MRSILRSVVSKLRFRLDQSFSVCLKALAADQLGRVGALGSQLVSGDPDSVHDMRVAFRRLRAILRMAKSAGDATSSPLRKGAKRIARVLGDVRNLDVLMEHIREYLDGAKAQADSACVKWCEVIRAERNEKLTEALASIHSKEHKKWKRRLNNWILSKGPTDRLKDTLPNLLAESFHELSQLGDLSDPTILHRYRIMCKRARYELEFFQSMLDPSARHSMDTLKEAQDSIGVLRDRQAAVTSAEKYIEQRGPRESDLDVVREFIASMKRSSIAERAIAIVVSAAELEPPGLIQKATS